jgi:STE24 endopeptidase
MSPTDRSTSTSSLLAGQAKAYHRRKLFFSVLSFLLLVAYMAGSGLFTRLSADLAGCVAGVISNRALAYPVFALLWYGIFKIATSPLDFYSGFVLEHRFGLSYQTLRAWVFENMKGLLVACALGLPLLCALQLILARFTHWWVVAGAIFFAFSVVLSQLAPVVLFPLFYKFSPMKNNALSDRLKQLGQSQGFRISNVFSFNMSKDTRKGNAALTGLFRTRRIIISDTLLEKLDDDEVVAVFAHELGHAGLGHMPRLVVLGGINVFAELYAASAGLDALLSLNPGRFSGVSDPAALPLVLFTFMAFGLAVQPLNNVLSRYFEKQADDFAVSLTNNPGALVSGLKKLGDQNLSDESPHPLVKWYAYSHPPLKERIARLAGPEVTENTHG